MRNLAAAFLMSALALAGCTPAPDAPPPGVAPAPAASLPLVPGVVTQEPQKNTQPAAATTVPARASYECREPTRWERQRVTERYQDYAGTVFSAVDLGEGWALIAMLSIDGHDKTSVITNGVRWRATGPDWDGVYIMTMFAGWRDAQQVAYGCLD